MNRTATMHGLATRLLGALLIVFTATTQAQGLEILVPAYFYPAGKGLGYWNQMATAAPKAPIVAILNPNSGPGTAVDPSYVSVVTDLRAAGGKVLGYVHTSYGARPLAQVTQDILLYQAFYAVDGFFIDEMANDGSATTVGYSASLYEYVKALNPAYHVIGNPGTNTREVYVSRPTADAVVVFEGDPKAYRRFTPDSWAASYPASRFGHLLYGVGDFAAARSALDLAAQRNAALVYATNDKLKPNPWDSLPSYWSSLITEVCLRNGGSAAVCN